MNERHQKIAELACSKVCELPDRTSPDDQPDMLMVTTGELRSAVLDALEAMQGPLMTKAFGEVLGKCPNCNGPLWRVTGRQAGNDMVDRCEKEILRAKVMADAIKRALSLVWTHPTQAEQILSKALTS